MSEEWRPVPGYPDYEVSDQGRVRSRRRYPNNPRLMTPHPDGCGYPKVNLSVDGKYLAVRVHRLVAAAFLGPKPESATLIRHLDDQKWNNIPANLAYGTNWDNAQDEIRGGRHWSQRRTHCVNGHPVVHRPDSGGICIECRRAQKRATRAKGREKALSAAADGTPYIAPIQNHGITGYQDHACRCDICLAAKAAEWARYLARRAQVAS